mgnify:CR=1 FL=1
MLKLANGSPSRRIIGVLAAALAAACAVPAFAEISAPATPNSGPAMGAMRQEMMQRMQQCMDQMPPMTSTVAMQLRQCEDKVTDGEKACEVTSNAPVTEDHFFVVPKVVE